MTSSNDRYELPETTTSDVRKMYIWLGGILGALLVFGIAIIFLAQTLVKFVPFSAEERFVEPYEKYFFDEKEELSDSGQIVQTYLEELVEKLQASNDLSEDIVFKIHYSEKPVENAFATLGGHMVIYRGLLDSLESENGLAMIIAHEMSHIEHRDPAAGMGRALAISMIIASTTGGYSDGVGDFLSEAGINQFSRKQERAADVLALEMLHKQYGHVGGHDEFFKKMVGEEDDTPLWLSSHPNIKERLAYLEKISTDKNYSIGATILYPEEVQSALAERPSSQRSR